MLEYLYAQVYVTRKVSKGVSHENTEERSASIFFSFSARNQISDQGLGDWQRLDVRWMAWNCKIIRFSRTDSAIKCYRGVETVSCLSSLPLSLLSPPPPVAGPATRCRQAACIDAAMFADQTDFITRWTRAVCWRKILNDRKAPPPLDIVLDKRPAGIFSIQWGETILPPATRYIYIYTYAYVISLISASTLNKSVFKGYRRVLVTPFRGYVNLTMGHDQWAISFPKYEDVLQKIRDTYACVFTDVEERCISLERRCSSIVVSVFNHLWFFYLIRW